jgi:hypothetical protein
MPKNQRQPHPSVHAQGMRQQSTLTRTSHMMRVYLGVCWYNDFKEIKSYIRSTFQNAIGSSRSYSWHSNLFVDDVLFASWYVDTPFCLAWDRDFNLFLLW